MRTEKEMMGLILSVADQDERIRAVYMNGSRANPDAPKDIFQDYDIVYAVREMQSLIRDREWIDVFGERLIMQLPDELDLLAGINRDTNKRYTYLMQFADGNRIDLKIMPIEYARVEYTQDSLTLPLLDKDSMLPPIPPSSDRDYWLKPPTRQTFYHCCNEFWWVSLYVAKGLWREEILYVLGHLNENVRPELVKMLCWLVGTNHGFSFSVGKYAKYLPKFLSKEKWNQFLKTYPAARVDDCWDSLIALCELFDETAKTIAEKWDFPYDSMESQRCLEYIRRVRQLPGDAGHIDIKA